MLSKEIFNPSSGLFRYCEESRTTYFACWDKASIEKEMLDEYELLGKLLGLAFYNGIALDINFAPALYKKLLHIPLTLDDLAEFDPSLAAGLSQLVQYEGDVENVYCRTFSIEIENPLGKHIKFDLVPDGDQVPVTSENRQDYVTLFVDTYLNEAVKTPFEAFQQGFNAIMEGSAISLFRPEELQELICGSPILDFHVLEKSTTYEGFEAESNVIKYFWEVVHEFTEEQKKQLLVFTTGSDRIPIGGLSQLQFVIARNGTDSDRLPTSHTCFNALLLADYASKEKLKDRLLVALENRNCGFYLN
jgi:ubiquitin-protein ligase E3 A